MRTASGLMILALATACTPYAGGEDCRGDTAKAVASLVSALQARDHKRAIGVWESCQVAETRTPDFMYHVAWAYVEAGRIDDALSLFRDVARATPGVYDPKVEADDPSLFGLAAASSSRYEIAEILWERGQTEDAILAAEAFVQGTVPDRVEYRADGSMHASSITGRRSMLLRIAAWKMKRGDPNACRFSDMAASEAPRNQAVAKVAAECRLKFGKQGSE